MTINKPASGWTEEFDVVIVGYGGAGAVAAINARETGAKVLIIEKQASDTATQTNHTPNTRMAVGAWYCPSDVEKAITYHEAMVKIANESLDTERKEMIAAFTRYLSGNAQWMESIGVETGPVREMSPKLREEIAAGRERPVDGSGISGVTLADFPDLPGADSTCLYIPKISGGYRNGAALFKQLSDAVNARDIDIMWETAGQHLVMEDGQVKGIIVRQRNKTLAIKAKRAVILTCGGFEYNDWMKENYLRVNPVHFYGNPDNTGDGINMVLEVGAALWHMNCAAWRVTMKFPDFPITFATQFHEEQSIIVDKIGQRFSNERFKLHSFGYELVNFDSYAKCYPRVPCYWIFDEKRRKAHPLASQAGACNPPGGIPGPYYHIWSEDNSAEIDRGWIMKANNLEDLAGIIKKDSENNELMQASVLQETVKRYNQHCKAGDDADYHRPPASLAPLEDPPYYAVKLWPGGPNTHGGPKRDIKSRVLRPDNTPIPRLYAAGELGSVWGMLYQGGAAIGECIAFGRVAGDNAAAEKPW